VHNRRDETSLDQPPARMRSSKAQQRGKCFMLVASINVFQFLLSTPKHPKHPKHPVNASLYVLYVLYCTQTFLDDLDWLTLLIETEVFGHVMITKAKFIIFPL
jgi:hypothetical protein